MLLYPGVSFSKEFVYGRSKGRGQRQSVTVYRRREKLRVGKVSRIALYVYRRKSFAMLILYTDLLLYKYKHVEANRRKGFTIATAIAKFAKLFPRVTFPAYGSRKFSRDEIFAKLCKILFLRF